MKHTKEDEQAAKAHLETIAIYANPTMEILEDQAADSFLAGIAYRDSQKKEESVNRFQVWWATFNKREFPALCLEVWLNCEAVMEAKYREEIEEYSSMIHHQAQREAGLGLGTEKLRHLLGVCLSNRSKQKQEIEKLKAEIESLRSINSNMSDVVDLKSKEIKRLEAELVERDKRIGRLEVNLNTCKNDYWFMSNLLEHYSINKEEGVKDCINRMRFRAPLFNILNKQTKE